MNSDGEKIPNLNEGGFDDDAFNVAQLALQMYQAGCPLTDESENSIDNDGGRSVSDFLREACRLLKQASEEVISFREEVEMLKKMEAERASAHRLEDLFDGDKVSEFGKDFLGKIRTRSGFERKLDLIKIDPKTVDRLVEVLKQRDYKNNQQLKPEVFEVISEALKKGVLNEFERTVFPSITLFLNIFFFTKASAPSDVLSILSRHFNRPKDEILESGFVTEKELKLLRTVKTT